MVKRTNHLKLKKKFVLKLFFQDGKTKMISCAARTLESEDVLIAGNYEEDAELCLDADPDMYLGNDAFMSSIVSFQTTLILYASIQKTKLLLFLGIWLSGVLSFREPFFFNPSLS